MQLRLTRLLAARRRRRRPATTGRRRRRSSTSGSARSPAPTSASTPTTSSRAGLAGDDPRRLAAEPHGRGAARPAGRPVLRRSSGSPARTRRCGWSASLASVATGAEAAGRGHRRRRTRRWSPSPSPRRATSSAGRGRRRSIAGGPRPARPARGRAAGASPRSTTWPDNGALLRDRVLEAAERLDPALARWIVERGARSRARSSTAWSRRRRRPTSTRSRGASVSATEAAVVAEHHRSWVHRRDRRPAAARPTSAWRSCGDIAPYERRKLWLLNGPHSALAYAGLLAGCDDDRRGGGHPVVSAVRPPAGRRRARGGRPPGVHEPGRSPTRRSGASPTPTSVTPARQVGADGSRKLPQRLSARGRGRREPSASARTGSPSSSPSGWPRSPASRAGRRLPGSTTRTPKAAPRSDWALVAAVLGRRRRPHLRRAGRRRTLDRLDARGSRRAPGGRHDRDPRRAPTVVLDDEAVAASSRSSSPALDLDGRCLCLVIPDATRQCPLPLLLGADPAGGRGSGPLMHGGRGPRHPRRDERRRACGPWSGSTASTCEPRVVGRRHVRAAGHARRRRRGPPVRRSPAEECRVRVNRLVVDSDVTVIVGPVLPHEVIGFSGGNKYLFPGLRDRSSSTSPKRLMDHAVRQSHRWRRSPRLRHPVVVEPRPATAESQHRRPADHFDEPLRIDVGVHVTPARRVRQPVRTG